MNIMKVLGTSRQQLTFSVRRKMDHQRLHETRRDAELVKRKTRHEYHSDVGPRREFLQTAQTWEDVGGTVPQTLAVFQQLKGRTDNAIND